MTLSNALPIQFWLSDEESYNTKEVCGVEQVCFCQPWNCDDEISLQFLTDDTNDYSLNIIDEDDTILENHSFSKALTNNQDYLSSFPLSGFTNGGGSGPDWTTGATPSVSCTGILQTSDPLSETLTDIPAGTYIFQYAMDFSGGGAGTFLISFRKNGVILFSTSRTSLLDPNGAITQVTATLSDEPDELRFVLTSSSGTISVTLSELHMYRQEYYHTVSFTPSAHCNKQVRFQIVSEASSPNEVVAYSDCVSLKEDHTCTLAIDYTNNKDFANMIYEDISPALTYKLRIPAIFFEEDTPAEQEDIELSNGEIVRLYNKLEFKKRLDIGFLPAYMHKKIQLVLMHDTVTIEGRQWIRRDAYEKKEGHRTFPLRRASVWLHDKDFIKENQL